MTTWHEHAARLWLGRSADDPAVATLVRSNEGAPETESLDRSAFVALCLRAGATTGVNAARTVLTAAQAPEVRRVWHNHRGAVLALLESFGSASLFWGGPHVARACASVFALLVEEELWGRRVGTGMSFRVVEALAFRTADALIAGADVAETLTRVEHCAHAFLADEFVGRKWASDRNVPPRWPDGTFMRHTSHAERAVDAVPFGSLCDPHPASWRDTLARRFAREAETDITIYDRAPLHVTAVSAMVESSGETGVAALRALDAEPLEHLPARLFAILCPEGRQ